MIAGAIYCSIFKLDALYPSFVFMHTLIGSFLQATLQEANQPGNLRLVLEVFLLELLMETEIHNGEDDHVHIPISKTGHGGELIFRASKRFLKLS